MNHLWCRFGGIWIGLIFCQLTFADIMPPTELQSCADTEFSFSDLEYYNPAELEAVYCWCKVVADVARKLWINQIERYELTANFRGAGHADTLVELAKLDARDQEMKTADNNLSKFERILNKEHEKDTLQCNNS